MVTHLLVGKAWVTEKTSSLRAYSAFWRSPKGLYLSYHCGILISEESGQGLPMCQVRFSPPAHESQLLVRHEAASTVLGCLHLYQYVGKGQVSRYRAVSDDHTCAISLG